MSSIDDVLSARGSRYGVFMDHARIAQNMKNGANRILKDRQLDLKPDQAEALDMIFHKIARILNGDPDYSDSWRDIEGYAKLVADRLEGEGK